MPSLSYLERLIEEEKFAMQTCEDQAGRAEDSGMKSLFAKLAGLKAQGVAALQAYLNEKKPSAEIVQQINDMFL